MERTMSVEEKIRRAEEIYERRRQGTVRPVATVSVNEKKDLKLFKKMIIQILLCITIYFIFYTINKNDYPFSKDFIKKANEVLSYDTNFIEIYENIKGVINGSINNNNNNEKNISEESIGGAEENTNEEQNKEEVQNNLENKSTENLTQEEQDVLKIKNTTTFIKPVEGTISSKYGKRENATGRVPKNHTGTDIAANLGTKIKSATDGEVVLASEEGDYRKTFKDSNRRSKYYLCTLQQSICKTRR